MITRRMTRVAAASSIALLGLAAMATPAMAAEADSAGPVDVQQAVGVPAGGTCADVVDPTLNLGVVSSGGWATSWGQWLNDGRGGVACTRTLTYDADSATWSVAD